MERWKEGKVDSKLMKERKTRGKENGEGQIKEQKKGEKKIEETTLYAGMTAKVKRVDAYGKNSTKM